MSVEIGAEAAQFPEKEYINGIAIAVQYVLWVTIYFTNDCLFSRYVARSVGNNKHNYI